MKKDAVRIAIVEAIIVVLYNMLVFMIPFTREAGFWISYGFTMAAIVTAIVAVHLGIVRSKGAKAKFYSFPIARIGMFYGVAQAAVGILVMALGQWLKWWIITLVYSVGMGAVIIMLISATATLEQIQTMDGQLKARVSRMRGLQSKLIHMEGQCADAEAAKAVKALAEELRYSDPVSGPAVVEAENELSAMVDAIQDAVADGESAVIVQLCSKASSLLAERNRLCKLNK